MNEEIDEIDQEDPIPLPKGFVAVKKNGSEIPLPKGFEPLKKKEVGLLGSKIGGEVGGGRLNGSGGGGSDFWQDLSKEKPIDKLTRELPNKINQDDPVGSARDVILKEMPSFKIPNITSSESTRQRNLSPLAQKAVSDSEALKIREKEEADRGKIKYQEGLDLIKEVENSVRQNTNNSLGVLVKSTGLSAKELYYLPEENIAQAVNPQNKTQVLAFQRLQDARNARNMIHKLSVLNPDRFVEEAAFDMAVSKDPIKAKTLLTAKGDLPAGQALSNKTMGSLIYDLFQESAFDDELGKMNPELHRYFSNEKYNLINHYQEFGKALMGAIVSQELEDSGKTSAFLENITKKELDEAVQSLKNKGTIGEKEVAFINENIRGKDTGIWGFFKGLFGESSIKTTGFVESTLKSGLKGFADVSKGVYEFAIPGIPSARQALVGNQRIAQSDLDKEINYEVKPKGILHEIASGGGTMLGQSLTIGIGGNYVKALKLAKSPMNAMGITAAAQAYANYIPQARAMFPDSEIKQRAYATILSTLEWKTEGIFNDMKVVNAITQKAKPRIRELIDGFTKKNISGAAARESFQGALTNIIRNTPIAAKHFTKATVQNTAEEVSMELGQQTTNGIFTGKPFKEWYDGQRLWEVARTTMLGSPFLSGLYTYGKMKNSKGVTAKMIYDMAQNKDYWVDKITEDAKLDDDLSAEAGDKIQNLEHAANILQELETTHPSLTEKQRVKYLITSLNNKVSESQKPTSQDLLLRMEQEKSSSDTIEENVKVQQDILSGKDDGSIKGDRSEEEVSIDQERELNQEGAVDPSGAIQNAIESGQIQGGHLMAAQRALSAEGGVEMFMKEVADQAHGGIKSLGVSNRERAVESYGQDLVNLAVKMFPKETTEQQPSTEEFKNAEQIVSKQDAETRLSNGERIFAIPEMDENPIELRNVGDLDKYTPDQLIAIPRKEDPFNSADAPLVSKNDGGNVISGDEVWERAEKSGSEHEDISDIEEVVRRKDYVQAKVPIGKLIENDPDLKEYLDNEKLPPKGRKVTTPIIVADISRGGDINKDGVVDGFHRIAQALANGETEIDAYVQSESKLLSTQPKAEAKNDGGNRVGGEKKAEIQKIQDEIDSFDNEYNSLVNIVNKEDRRLNTPKSENEIKLNELQDKINALIDKRNKVEQFLKEQPKAEGVNTKEQVSVEGKVKSKLAAFKEKYATKEEPKNLKPIKRKRKGDNKAAMAAKKVYKDIGEIDEPSDARGLALAYLAGGGKVSEASINDVAGNVKKAELNVWWRKKKKTGEVRARDYASKDAPTFDEIAHEIWDNLPENLDGITTQDIKDELMDVVNSHNTRLSAAEEFRDRYIQDVSGNDLTENEAKEIDDIQQNQLLKIVFDVPESQQDLLVETLKRYQDRYGLIDWDRLDKDFNGFDPDLLSLPEEAITALDGLVKKHIESGQGESPNLNDKGLSPKESKSQEKANAPPVERKKISFERNDEKIKEKLKNIDDLLKELGKPDLTMGGLSKIEPLTKLIGNLIEVGYYKIEDIAKFLVEKGYNEWLPYLKDAYNGLKSKHEFSPEVKTSLSNESDINKFHSSTKGDNGQVPQRGTVQNIQGRQAPVGTGGGKGGSRPPIRIADEANLPTPKKDHVVDGKYDIDETQRFGANAAIDRFDNKHKAFLLADGAGVGKTREQLVIGAEMQKKTGKKTLIVTESQSIIDDSFAKDAKAMGIDISDTNKWEIGTYYDLTAGKIGKGDYGVAIYDEAHNLKNPMAARSIEQSKVKSDHNVFATATPYDKIEHSIFFFSQLTGRTPKEIQKEVGVDIEYQKGRDGEMYAVAKTSTGPKDYYEKTDALRGEVVKQGGILRREYPFYGEMENKEMAMSPEGRKDVNEIDVIHANRLDNADNIGIGRVVNSILNPKTAGGEFGKFKNDLANKLAFNDLFTKVKKDYEAGTGSYYSMAKEAIDKVKYDERKAQLANLDKINEQDKVQSMYDAVKKDLAAGKKSIVVGQFSGEHTIKAGDKGSKYGYYEKKIPAEKTLLNQLAKRLQAEGISVAKIYGGTKENEKFQQGKADVALMTTKSGGTGINLDDVVGDKPRVMHIATSEYSGNKTEQLFGRVSRRNTQSPAKINSYFFKDNAADTNRRTKSEEKQETIRSIVAGRELSEVDKERIKESADGLSEAKPKKEANISLEKSSPGKFVLTGDTFDIKDTIKELGGRWEKYKKGWEFPESKQEEVKAELAEKHPDIKLNFSIQEKTPEAISDMKDIVKDLVEEGNTSLKGIQKVVADELGDNSQEMKDLVEDSYNEFGKEPIDKGVTEGVVGQVGKFISRLFGGKPQEKVYIARDTKALMAKAEEVGNPKFQEVNAVFETRDGKPIGFNYDTDKVARERFDIPNLRRIGGGSDRDVFDLGNGKVLKVAKTARGLAQNIHEGDWYLIQQGLLPEAFEKGLNYVVTENVESAVGNTKINKMLAELSKFSPRDFELKETELQDALNKYELGGVMDYNLIWNDFVAKRNWGVKGGEPIHLDGGTYGGTELLQEYRGKKNLSDPEFREIYNKSRALKKKYGDTDKFTMYHAQPQTSEQKATTKLLNDAKAEYQAAKNAFDTKRKQLDKEVLKDQEDLFGERKATQEAAGSLFDERVSQSARDKAIEPFKARMLKAENEVNRLQKKLDSLGNQTAQTSLFMKSPNGKILGFTHNNKIYLNGEHLNPNTPIHEAGHIWTEWIKQNQPEVYKRGMELVTGTRYLTKAQESEFYQEESTKLPQAEREVYFKHEALAMAIGDKGAEFVTEARRTSFKEWLNNLWDSIKEAVGFKDITTLELSELTFDEFTKRAAKEILTNKDNAQSKAEAQKTKLTEERDAAVNDAMRPELSELVFSEAQELGDRARTNIKISKQTGKGETKERVEYKRLAKEESGIRKRLRQLEKIMNDCLWGKK